MWVDESSESWKLHIEGQNAVVARLEYPWAAFRLRFAIIRVSPVLRKDRLIWHAINIRGKKADARRLTFRDCSCSRSGASS